MSTSATAALAVRGRTGRSTAPTIEIAVPPHRASLSPAGGALRASTVLVVAPGHAAWAPLTAGMLEMGIGRVVRAESSAAVDAIIAQRAPGDLALVSTALGDKTSKVIRRLRAAGWQRVVALATGADPTPVISALLSDDDDGDRPGPRADRRSGREPELTRRQLAVLRCVAQGLSVKKTAQELGTSAPTVKRHLRHIADELGCRDVTEIVASAARLGLLG
jgi:DNA-binding CsgD family transcriptional regulator